MQMRSTLYILAALLLPSGDAAAQVDQQPPEHEFVMKVAPHGGSTPLQTVSCVTLKQVTEAGGEGPEYRYGVNIPPDSHRKICNHNPFETRTVYARNANSGSGSLLVTCGASVIYFHADNWISHCFNLANVVTSKLKSGQTIQCKENVVFSRQGYVTFCDQQKYDE